MSLDLVSCEAIKIMVLCDPGPPILLRLVGGFPPSPHLFPDLTLTSPPVDVLPAPYQKGEPRSVGVVF